MLMTSHVSRMTRLSQSLLNREICQKQMGNQILLRNRQFGSPQQSYNLLYEP